MTDHYELVVDSVWADELVRRSVQVRIGDRVQLQLVRKQVRKTSGPQSGTLSLAALQVASLTWPNVLKRSCGPSFLDQLSDTARRAVRVAL